MVSKKKQTSKDTQPKVANWSTLKGKFFHNFDEGGYVMNQGEIVDLVGEDIAIVQLFSLVMGEPTYQKAFWVEDIVDGRWALYSTAEEMREVYEIGLLKPRPIKK